MISMTTQQTLSGATFVSAVRGDHGCVDTTGVDRQRFVGGALVTGQRALTARAAANGSAWIGSATYRTPGAIGVTPLLPTTVPTGTSTYGPPV